MAKPKTKVIKWFVWSLSDSEKRAVHKGPRGATCRSEDLCETALKAARAAEDLGAKSWDIIPLIQFGKHKPRVGIKLYNRADFGLCMFPPDGVNGRPAVHYFTGKASGKNHYWFDDLPQPHHLDQEHGVYDSTQGRDWHPELQ